MIITDALTGEKKMVLEPIEILSGGRWVRESGSDYADRMQEQARYDQAVREDKAWAFGR